MRHPARILLSVAAACALALGAMSPASAAVTYTSQQGPIGEVPAIDSSTNIIYSVITDKSVPNWEHVYINAVNGNTLQSVGTYTIADHSLSESWVQGVTDLRVNSKTHTLWFSGSLGKAGTYIEQINGTTLQQIRRYDLGGSFGGTMAVDPATGSAYIAANPNTQYGSENPNSFVRQINATTGAVTDLDLPGSFGDANTAWDSANSAVYVTQAGKVYAISSKLKLASTLTLPNEAQTRTLGITADGTTHTIYVTGTRLYAIAGTTNTVSRSVPLASPGLPVIDPGISTVYVGTGVYSAATLAQTGTLPHPATSVNGPTHAIYAAGTIAGGGWKITRPLSRPACPRSPTAECSRRMTHVLGCSSRTLCGQELAPEGQRSSGRAALQ